MRKIETAFYSGLIIGAYLLSGCRPTDSDTSTPISLAKGQEKTAPSSPTPTSEIKPQNAAKETILSEATVTGFTVEVIDTRKNKTTLGEWPDAPKIAERMVKEIPDIRAKIAQEMENARKYQPDLSTWDGSFKIVLSNQIIVGGGRVTAYARNFDQIDIDLELVALWSQRDPQHNLDYILAHELAHTWAILSGIGLGPQLEETAEKNLYRFRGLTTTAVSTANPPSSPPPTPCFVHNSQYGETVSQIIETYRHRYDNEILVTEMRYNGKPNTAGPTTRLGEGWEITLCPK